MPKKIHLQRYRIDEWVNFTVCGVQVKYWYLRQTKDLHSNIKTTRLEIETTCKSCLTCYRVHSLN